MKKLYFAFFFAAASLIILAILMDWIFSILNLALLIRYEKACLLFFSTICLDVFEKKKIPSVKIKPCIIILNDLISRFLGQW